MMIAQRFVHQKNDVEDCRRRRSIDRRGSMDALTWSRTAKGRRISEKNATRWSSNKKRIIIGTAAARDQCLFQVLLHSYTRTITHNIINFIMIIIIAINILFFYALLNSTISIDFLSLFSLLRLLLFLWWLVVVVVIGSSFHWVSSTAAAAVAAAVRIDIGLVVCEEPAH